MPEESITTKWSRLYASLYYYLGKAMLDRFGEAGEKALRHAIHSYGSYRASRVRADHEARELAINLANMMNEGDMPNTDSLESENRVCTPAYFRTTVTECTLYDAWQNLGSVDIGRVYCEEVHEPLYCGYAAGVTLEMPDFMTKGDQICTFILTLPDAQGSAAKGASGPREVDGTHPEAKIARLYGVLYCFLAQGMLNAFGNEGETVLRQALGVYARREAKSLNEDQLAQGWELCQSTLTPTEGHSTVSGQAVLDAWREVEGNKTPAGLIYFKEIRQAIQDAPIIGKMRPGEEIV